MTDEMNGQDMDLFGLIGQATYQTVSDFEDVNLEPDAQPDVTQGADSTPGGATDEDLSSAAGNADAPAAEEQPDGVTNQQPVTPPVQTPNAPQYTPEQVARMQEQIVNQQRYINMHAQQIRAEQERQFRQQLAEMSEEERRAAIAERQAQQLALQNRYLQQQFQERERNEQEGAKRTLATMIAGERGIPLSMSPALLAANNLEEMESIADQIASDLQARSAPAAPAAQEPVSEAAEQKPNPNPAAFVAGGESGSSHTLPDLEPGSGDVMGLITRTAYSVGSM